jgi:ABC-2 type transport system ATP-binding protein
MIEARGLTKRYGPTTAVDGLSFDVRPGTVTGFLGPNGSGKSTTMRMIIGLDRPDAGRARIGGRRYAELRWPLREVGALLEARGFHPGRPARAHLAALAASNGIPAARVDAVLAQTGLGSVAGKRPGKFSLGMPSGWASPPRCSATHGCCCSTSRSTAWTRRASAGSATC